VPAGPESLRTCPGYRRLGRGHSERRKSSTATNMATALNPASAARSPITAVSPVSCSPWPD